MNSIIKKVFKRPIHLIFIIFTFTFHSIFSCHPGEHKHEQPSSQIINPTKKETTKIILGSQMLEAIKKNLAEQDPMRGGILFGLIENKRDIVVNYFLYDSFAAHSGSSYTTGARIDDDIRTALEKINPVFGPSFMVGMALSSPGAISYVYGNNEKNIEKFFANNPDYNFYIYAVVTRGPSTMKTLETHEIKLGPDSKISFFIKRRGYAIHALTNIEVKSQDCVIYKKLHSDIGLP
jgi:hypothetical protein